MAKKFNLAALVPEMAPVSESDTPRITMIPITELRPNGGNFYDTSSYEDLVASIEMNGLLEPLCVFRRGQGTGSYVIFSGHRRYKALRSLYERSNFKRWAEVPCIVYPDPHDLNRETVMLIHANSTGRVLSNWEKAEQARRLKNALVALRENGSVLPGRIRDLVAEEMQISASKLARLDAIRSHLTEVRFAKAWRESQLNETVAYELSKLPEERQREAWDEYLRCGFGNPANMSIKEAAAFCDGKDIFGHSAAPGIVSESDTRETATSQPPAAEAAGAWRRCLVDEPEEGQLVLVVEPAIAAMPDVCIYRGGQFIDEIGDGEPMEVKSFWLWLPLPPLPKEDA